MVESETLAIEKKDNLPVRTLVLSKHNLFGDISRIVTNFDPTHKGSESSPIGNLTELLDNIVQWAHAHLGEKAFVEAKDAFQSICGKVFHDDNSYHQRMNYFLDYFIFQWKIADNTPFECFIEDSLARSNFHQHLKDKIAKLEGFSHSLFVFYKKSKKDGLLLQDLFTKSKIRLHTDDEESFLRGTNNSIIQGFLFPWDDQYALSQGFIVHPKSTYSLLKKPIKLLTNLSLEDKNLFLLNLLKNNLAFSRAKHPEVKKIYQLNIPVNQPI